MCYNCSSYSRHFDKIFDFLLPTHSRIDPYYTQPKILQLLTPQRSRRERTVTSRFSFELFLIFRSQRLIMGTIILGSLVFLFSFHRLLVIVDLKREFERFFRCISVKN